MSEPTHQNAADELESWLLVPRDDANELDWQTAAQRRDDAHAYARWEASRS